jgi:hypothetical protein
LQAEEERVKVNPETATVDNQPALTIVKKPAAEPPSGVDLLADKIRSLEQWYAADFERRVSSITELLKARISEELQAQFKTEQEQQSQRVRQEYEERLYNSMGDWSTQKAAMQKEIEELKGKAPSAKLQAEIASVEAALGRYESVGNAALDGQASPAQLSRMLQGKAEEMEMRAYLRGLKFRNA